MILGRFLFLCFLFACGSHANNLMQRQSKGTSRSQDPCTGPGLTRKRGQEYTLEGKKYDYKLVLGKTIKQKQKTGTESWLIGNYASGTNDTETYDNGDGCPDGIKRQATITFVEGEQPIVLQEKELSTCNYDFEFQIDCKYEPLALCCGMLKNFPDMIPTVTWGSMAQEKIDQWGQNNCETVVGGRSKANCGGWKMYPNYCVSETNEDLPTTYDAAGNSDVDACKSECIKVSRCSAIEMENSQGVLRCYLMLSDVPAAKGFTGKRYKDATCYIRPDCTWTGDVTCGNFGNCGDLGGGAFGCICTNGYTGDACDTPPGGCISWRQTMFCDGDGHREPSGDKDCETTIEYGWSGYCQCQDGGPMMKKGCGRADYLTCNDACLSRCKNKLPDFMCEKMKNAGECETDDFTRHRRGEKTTLCAGSCGLCGSK